MFSTRLHLSSFYLLHFYTGTFFFYILLDVGLELRMQYIRRLSGQISAACQANVVWKIFMEHENALQLNSQIAD